MTSDSYPLGNNEISWYFNYYTTETSPSQYSPNIETNTSVFNNKSNSAIQIQSARQIVKELKKAIKGWNDNDAIKAALAKIDDPLELKEVERLLSAEGYKADNYYSVIEKFMYKELSESKFYDKSFDLLEERVQKWISNGTLQGDDAINAQARLAARLVIDGCDGFGTDVAETKEGIRLIRCPKPTGNKANDKENAQKVYEKVNQIISKHKSFGAGFKNLKDYLKGDLWASEIKYLDGILAQNNALLGPQKTTAITNLIQESVEGAGTDIEYLKQAIMAIDSPQDRVALNARLQQYCNKKGIKAQILGQKPLQSILYDECDTFLGVSTDHKEIRNFNEMLIKQGAYTKNEAIVLRAEQAALQILDSGFAGILDAVQNIKDPKVLAEMNQLLTTKDFKNLDDLMKKKKLSQTKTDLVNAELASKNLLPEDKAVEISCRLLQNSDFNNRAMGLKAIRTNQQAIKVNEKLKMQGTSLAQIYEQFNKEKANYKTKAAVWDGFAFVIGDLAETISDEYRKNTEVADNLYLEADRAVPINPEQKQAYEMTVQTFEQQLEQMKTDYQNALDSQGIVSGAINAFCSHFNIGTTRDDIEARITYDTETLRLLKLAAEGKLTKLADGKNISVSFEEIFKERQSEFVTANPISVSGINNAINGKEVTTFDTDKVQKIADKAKTIAAMDIAKDYISVCWDELQTGLNSNDNKQLSVAIADTLDKLSQMSGKKLSLNALGYSFNDGVITYSSGVPVNLSVLKELSSQLKQGLSDISAELLGSPLPANADRSKVNDLLETGYKSKMDGFKKEYREAFGQNAPDNMIENYVSTINTGKTVLNIGTAIGAVIAAPFTGGGSLAIFTFTAATTIAINALEKSTDADGYTNSEWTSDAQEALWNGALSAVGFKVGSIAEKAANGGYEIAQTVIKNNKALISKLAPSISPATLEKVSVWVARAEAAGFEVSSDSLQAILQSYCMEGEFNEKAFLTALLISAAGNSAGHFYNAKIALKNQTTIPEPPKSPEVIRQESIQTFKNSLEGCDEATANELANLAAQNVHIQEKMVQLAANCGRYADDAKLLLKMATPENIDDLILLTRNKTLDFQSNGGVIVRNDFDTILKAGEANPVIKSDLIDIASNTQRPADDISNIVDFMNKYPAHAHDIATLTKSNPNIKANYNLDNTISPDIENIVKYLQENPQYHDEIIDYMKVQRRALNDTSDPVELLGYHIQTLKDFPRLKNIIKELTIDPNLDAPAIRSLAQKYANTPDLENVLFFARKGFSPDAIERKIQFINANPRLKSTIMSPPPAYKFIDNNVSQTSAEILNKRASIKARLQQAAPEELEILRKTIGEKFYPNIKWEEIIPANATRQEIKNILTELNDKSKFFARTSFNENNYGKNIQWAHEMSLISKSAEYRIRNGESFENVIDDIARNYRDYDEATTLDSNIEISDRRLYSGVYRGNNPPQLEAFGYVTPFGKTDMYEEYFDRFMSKFDKPRQNPYPDMQLTELKKLEQGFDDFSFTIDVMSHPPNQTINAGMKHIAEKFEELKPLFEKVRNGGKLSAAEKQLADEKISEMYFLMANIMPWAKGTNGISDIFMRSTYNALNINQPALKQGVSLDLESFYTELDEYKAKWNTFFEEE